jgi:prevent-host-death family protein
VESVNIHEAKTRLSQLIARAQQGEGFIIAKAGKPMVRVTPIDSPAPEQQKRLGFLAGQFRVPDDFDRMAEQEIASMFGV